MRVFGLVEGVFRAVRTWSIVLWILRTCDLSVNFSETSICDMIHK